MMYGNERPAHMSHEDPMSFNYDPDRTEARMQSAMKANYYPICKYAGAILIDDEYKLVRRSDGKVYLYDTKDEAQAMLRLAYTDASKTEGMTKVMKLEESQWLGLK